MALADNPQLEDYSLRYTPSEFRTWSPWMIFLSCLVGLSAMAGYALDAAVVHLPHQRLPGRRRAAHLRGLGACKDRCKPNAWRPAGSVTSLGMPAMSPARVPSAAVSAPNALSAPSPLSASKPEVTR
ncbi:MAG: hypothetical protein QOD04_4007 [Pseudonocardiales bacterium]|jgi:hypothetical protein|nr:hypothetical protein [Pseudonocardiales bacterium]